MLTIRLAQWYARVPFLTPPEPSMRRAFHLFLSVGVALIAFAGLAAAKDTVTIGMVLEPPGLDPTTAPAAAIGEVTHYNIFEGLTKINEDFSVTPLLAEKWDFSPDLKTLTFTLKPNVKFQDGEPFSSKDVKFSFEHFAAKDSTNKDKGFFALINSIDTPDPMTVVLKFKAPSFEALFHLGMNTAVILDEKSAAAEATNPSAPVHTSSPPGRRGPRSRWTSGTAPRPLEDPARTRDLPLHLRPVGRGGGDACRRRRRFPAFRQCPVDRPVQVRPTLPGADRRHRGQDDSRHEQQEEATRRAQGAAGDRLCHRPQGGHRRRNEQIGAPIGSHLTPNDPGYVDLTGMYPHDPAKSKELLKQAGVTTPLDLSLILPPPPYARQGGQIIAAELAEVGINAKIQEVEWAQWLSGVYKDHNYDLTIISHVEPLDIGIYADPNYYFQYDSPAFQAIYAKVTSAPNLEAYKAALGEAQKKIAEDCVNAFLFQLPNVTVASAKLQGLWKNAPIFVDDLSEMSWK